MSSFARPVSLLSTHLIICHSVLGVTVHSLLPQSGLAQCHKIHSLLGFFEVVYGPQIPYSQQAWFCGAAVIMCSASALF